MYSIRLANVLSRKRPSLGVYKPFFRTEKQQVSREAQVGGVCSEDTVCDIFSSAEGAFTCLQLVCRQGVSQKQWYRHNQGNSKLQGGKGACESGQGGNWFTLAWPSGK